MLALVPLLVPVATAAVTAGAMLILLMAINEWWLPQQPDATTPRLHFFTRFVKWTRQKLSDALRAARKKLASALANAVASRSHAAVKALDNVTELVLRTSGTLADQAEQIYKALYALRHVTMPAEIAAALRPVIQRLNTAFALATAATNQLTAVSVAIADGLRTLPWGVPLGLPNRVAALMNAFEHLWHQFFEITRPQLTELFTQTLPAIRADIADLYQRIRVNIDARFEAIAARVTALEGRLESIVLPRIAALELAVQALTDAAFGAIGDAVLALTTRIVALEQQIADVVLPRLAALEQGLVQLRTELEQGIATGLEAFRTRIEALEQAVTQTIPARLAALELAVQALVDAAFGEIGAAILALTQRIVAIEQEIQNRVLPGIDLVIGRITALETRIDNVILPRLSALEAILAPAAFAALVLATMQRIAPNLFCRNVTSASRALCADDEAFWDALLAGTLIFAIALNPREVAQAGQALTGALGGVIAETVNH